MNQEHGQEIRTQEIRLGIQGKRFVCRQANNTRQSVAEGPGYI